MESNVCPSVCHANMAHVSGRHRQASKICRRRQTTKAFRQRLQNPKWKTLPCRCQASEGGKNSSPISQNWGWANVPALTNLVKFVAKLTEQPKVVTSVQKMEEPKGGADGESKPNTAAAMQRGADGESKPVVAAAGPRGADGESKPQVAAAVPRDGEGESNPDIAAAFPRGADLEDDPAAAVPLGVWGRPQFWDVWLEKFRRLDEKRHEFEYYSMALETAAALEHFEDAAEMKLKVDELAAEDHVGLAIELMSKALNAEDYEMASHLRDKAGFGLVGWWVAQSESDPCGHLLQIVPDFGRYIGIMYDASELADLKAYMDSVGDEGSGQESWALEAQFGSSNGKVAMEVFLDNNEGEYELRPVVLPPGAPGPLRVTFFGSSGTGDFTTLEVEAEMAAPSSGLQNLSPPFEASRGDATQVSGSNLQPEASNSDEEAHAGSAGPSSTEDEGGDEVDTVEGLAEFTLAEVDEIGEIVERYTPSLDRSLQAALEGFVQDGGEIQVEAGEPLGPVVREPASLLMLDCNRFALSTLKAPPEEEATSTSSASARRKDAKAQFLGAKRGSQDKKPPVPDALKGVYDATMQLQGALNPHVPTPEPQKADSERRNEGQNLLQSEKGIDGLYIYSRLTSPGPPTDPFSGYFVGAFGPHGHELLRLQRFMEDGEEIVVGTKLTGDFNVPAGAPSFKAKIGRQHRLPSREYPQELGVVGRFKGLGRIAQKGYNAPKWVDGELLQFSASGYLTRGAEMGFVWKVPGGRHYLILLSRIELPEIF
eukprot:jgi/Botrbrau1/18625/Bobra.0367s0062.1